VYLLATLVTIKTLQLFNVLFVQIFIAINALKLTFVSIAKPATF
jgi:hypothetical protein